MKQQKHFPIIGTKYNNWEIIDNKTYKVPSNRASYWKVRCKCGYETIRCSTHLVNLRGQSCKSCAALKFPFEQSYLRKIKERAKKSGFEFDLTLDYLNSIFNGKCKLTGLDIQFGKHWKLKLSDQTASLDRIDSEKGYIKGNVQWVHKDINRMKWAFTEKYFIELCKKVVTKCG